MLQAAYEAAQAEAAREKGIEVWVYNGVLPRTGTYLRGAREKSKTPVMSGSSLARAIRSWEGRQNDSSLTTSAAGAISTAANC